MNPMDILNEYYRAGSEAHKIVVRHGEDVTRKAIAVAHKVRHLDPDFEFIREAAMLHKEVPHASRRGDRSRKRD